jgi:3-phosphoshikimate 1-carboxyvinyltransferase
MTSKNFIDLPSLLSARGTITLPGLRTLGVVVEQLESHVFRVQGCGGNFPVKQAESFLGNAGTAFRPLKAALALSGGDYKKKNLL